MKKIYKKLVKALKKDKKYLLIVFLFVVLVFQTFFIIKNQRKSENMTTERIKEELSNCTGDNKTVKCWQETVERVFEEEGLGAAFDIIDYLYGAEPTFASTCHDFGHLLGENAYYLFEEDEDFEITPKTAFCSYGFYHGFMELLVSRFGEPQKARDFCKKVQNQLGDKTPDAYLQCFHGIGHGWVNVHDRPDLWGDSLGIVKPALRLCRDVSANSQELTRCATGVFNGLSIFYSTGEYGLSVPDDPLALCRKMDEEFKDPCYVSMNIPLWERTNGDFLEAARYVERIENDIYAKHAMLNLVLPLGVKNLSSENHDEVIKMCRSLQERLQIECLQGYGFSFLENGEPGVEYVKAINFCKSDILSDEEKKGCLEYVYSYLGQWYSKDMSLAICNEQEDEYKDFCKLRVENTINAFEEQLNQQ